MEIKGVPMGFCENEKSRPLDPDYQEIRTGSIFFSFDIKFFYSDKTVAERAEDYKQLGNDQIHWWSLISSSALNVALILAVRSLLKKPLPNPSKLNSLPTSGNTTPLYVQALPLLEGLLPFATIFVELKYLMIAFWQHKYYYLYPYLFAALLILAITSASVSIIMTYFNLKSGNQTLSFWDAGSVGYYVFAYAVLFFFTQLDLTGFSAQLKYFAYTLVLSFLIMVFSGVSGLIASSWFIRNISPQALESKQK